MVVVAFCLAWVPWKIEENFRVNALLGVYSQARRSDDEG